MTEHPRPYGTPAEPYGGPGKSSGTPEEPYGAPGESYGSPAQPSGGAAQPYGSPPATPQNSRLSIISLVLAGLALVILPLLLGPAAIVLASFGRRRCEPLARVAFPVAIAATVIGVLITFVLLAAMD